MSVDVSKHVIGLLITHWHNDHIEGAFEILKRCESAKLYQTGALCNEAAYNLVALYNKDIFSHTDEGIEEFREITNYLIENNQINRFKRVQESTCIFNFNSSIPSSLFALSPSDTAVSLSIKNLVDITPKENTRRRNLLPTGQNLNSVACHFKFGETSVLLGSDLETTSNVLTGWNAIFNNNLYSTLGLNKSAIYKVAHHGSVTAHHVDIWDDLLEELPVSVATPYARSHIPNESDIGRISGLSRKLYISRDPTPKKPPKKEKMVDQEMNSIVTKRYLLKDKMGHVQIRFAVNSTIDVFKNEPVIEF